MNIALSIAFGVSFIACLFLVAAWSRVLLDKEYNHNTKYMLLASGLLVANAGVGILALNRTLIALSGAPDAPKDTAIYPVLLLVAAVAIVVGKVTLVKATTMGHIPPTKTMTIFALLSAAWVVFCLWYWM